MARYLQFRKVLLLSLSALFFMGFLMPSFIAGCFDVVSDKVHMSRQLLSKRRVPAVDERGLQQRQPRKSAGKAA